MKKQVLKVVAYEYATCCNDPSTTLITTCTLLYMYVYMCIINIIEILCALKVFVIVHVHTHVHVYTIPTNECLYLHNCVD